MKIPRYLLNDKCTILPLLGDSPSGKVFEANYLAKCKVQYSSRLITDENGIRPISKAQFTLLPNKKNLNLKQGSIILYKEVEYIVSKVEIVGGFTPSFVKVESE